MNNDVGESNQNRHACPGHHWMKNGGQGPWHMFHGRHHGPHHHKPRHHDLFHQGRHHRGHHKGHHGVNPGRHHHKHGHGHGHHKHGPHKLHKGCGPQYMDDAIMKWRRIHLMFFQTNLRGQEENRQNDPVREEAPVADIQNQLSRLHLLALPNLQGNEEAQPGTST